MKCDSNLLEDYVEGFLETSEQQIIKAHLQGCSKCQCEYEQLINEQKTLFAQLNTSLMTYSQGDTIMQRIQTNTKPVRKKYWQTLKITVISAAVIVLSFVFYYWNRTPNEVVQPIDEPIQSVEMNSSNQRNQLEVEHALNYNEPFLDVSIDKTVENGENIDIDYRVKFKEEYQRYQDNLYEQIRMRYQYKEMNLSQIDPTLDDFFGKVRSKVQFAIRDESGQLISSTKNIEGEQPIINEYSISGGGTNLLGEWIYTTSIPSSSKPATFEVLSMETNVFDLFEVEVNAAQIQPFQFSDATYTIDALEIKKDTLHVQISTEGEPDVRPQGWELVINNQLYFSDRATTDFYNNRTVYKLQFDGHKQIPTMFKLAPDTVHIKTQINPIVLDLR